MPFKGAIEIICNIIIPEIICLKTPYHQRFKRYDTIYLDAVGHQLI